MDNAAVAMILHKLVPTGPQGFEGLVAHLLETLTGRRFFLARSGRQEGRDMISDRWSGNVIAVECKRFKEDTGLDERALIAELQQASRDVPSLEMWILVSSRSVDDQIITRLLDIGRKDGVEVYAISAADGILSSLSVLCANALNVIEHFETDKWAPADRDELIHLLNEVYHHADYEHKLSRLRMELSSPFVGHDNLRTKSNTWLLATFSTETAARAAFHQPLHVTSDLAKLIPRKAAKESLDKWFIDWNNQQKTFVLTGEEGDGKTWGIASWVNEKIRTEQDFPPVLFLTSFDVTSTDISTIITSHLSQRYGEPSPNFWTRRLDRWKQSETGTSPVLLIVFDGINERQDSKFWRTLLESLMGPSWKSMLAVVVTCRSGYWNRHFVPLRHIDVQNKVLQPFSESELEMALAARGFTKSDFPTELLNLMSKPRYLDMAITYQDRMAVSGDYTVPRLIFEDWRNRYEKKSGNIIDPSSFEDFIKDLAVQASQRGTLRGNEITGLLPPDADISAMLEEMRTGGIIDGQGNTYHVNEQRLILGFGLLLIDEVRRGESNNAEKLREIVAGWLEPSGADLMAKICGMAVCAAMEDPNFSTAGRTALLQAWIECQNLYEGVDHEFQAYLPADPECYAALAEHVWSYGNNRRGVQELILRALIRWGKESLRVREALPSILERWLGMINITGYSWQREPSTSDRTKVRREISERLGREISHGDTIEDICNRTLLIIEDDGLLRLGRAALAIISHLPREPFLSAIATGCLAEEIIGFPEKHALFSWILRSSPSPITPKLIDVAETLIASGNPLGIKAAYRFMGYEGSDESISARDQLPHDLFPVRLDVIEHRKDPCQSFYSLTRAECEQCLHREDVPPWALARKIKSYCSDPNLPKPPGLADRLAPLINTINLSEMMTNGGGSTPTEGALNDMEPALCAYAPEALAELIQRLATTVQTRSGLSLCFLAQFLLNHSLVLQESDFKVVHQTWETLLAMAEPWDEETKSAELFLFASVLKHLSVSEQLDALLLRPAIALDWTAPEASFKPIEKWGQIESHLNADLESFQLRRLLWFMTTNIEVIPQSKLPRFYSLAMNDDAMVRLFSLAILREYQRKNPGICIQVGWRWIQECNEEEAHWGSLLLAEATEAFSYEEVHSRIHPSYLAYAFSVRAHDTRDREQFICQIEELGTNIDSEEDIPDIPPAQVFSDLNADVPQFEKVSLDYETMFPAQTFTSSDAHWGGVMAEDQRGFSKAFAARSQKEIKLIWQVLSEALREQIGKGHFWMVSSFYSPVLAEIAASTPELLDAFILPVLKGNDDSLRRIFFNRGLYEALTKALLIAQPEAGAKLYRILKHLASRIRFTATETGCDIIDHYLFSAPSHPAIVDLWNEWGDKVASDADLLNLVIFSVDNRAAREWLHTRVNIGLDSNIPFLKAQSFMIIGFLGEYNKEMVERSPREYSSIWLDGVAKRAESVKQSDLWAKHWYRQFICAEDDIIAWAAFRLLLQCVDRRFWYWKHTEEDSFRETNIFQKRIPFLMDNQSELKKAIVKNEGAYEKNFLCQKVEKGHAWPWMEG